MADAARAESRGRDGARAGSNAGSRLTAISGARRSGVRGGSVFRRILEAGVARGAAAFGRRGDPQRVRLVRNAQVVRDPDGLDGPRALIALAALAAQL